MRILVSSVETAPVLACQETVMPFSNLETVEEAASLAQCLDELSAAKEEALPLSTYRLQFNRDFRFEDARRLVSYLYRLGSDTLLRVADSEGAQRQRAWVRHR